MDDVQCNDSFSDDEMLDDAPESQYDELPLSLPAADDADINPPKPDHDIRDACREQIASPNLASSPEFEADDERMFSSRVHPPADQQQTIVSASPEEVTIVAGTSVLARIENIFEAMADVLLNERGQLSVELVTRPPARRQHIDHIEATPAQNVVVHRLCFPGKTEREAWRFGEHDLAASTCSHTDF
jgi:hypothetical protein